MSTRRKSASTERPANAASHAALISGRKCVIAFSHTEPFIMKMPLFQKYSPLST